MTLRFSSFGAAVADLSGASTAGAMVYVVVEEVIPEAQRSGNADLATVALMIGFTFMMILDVELG